MSTSRRLLLSVAVIVGLGAGILTGSDLLACGDKFLVPSRGTRFQRPPPQRQAADILIYAPPASGLAPLLGSADGDETLRRAGYRPTSIVSAQDLELAINRGGWALVLVGAADAASLRDRFTGSEAPVILPVLRDPTKAQLAEAKAHYPRVLQAPAKHQSLLNAVDDALELRAATRARARR